MKAARREIKENRRVIERQIEILERATSVSRYALPAQEQKGSNSIGFKVKDLDLHREGALYE